MKIVDANTPYAADEILDLLRPTLPKNVDPATLEVWLRTSLGTDIFGAWISYNGGEKAEGLILCEIIQEEKPKCFVSFTWTENNSTCFPELLNKVEQWAKQKGLNEILAYMHRNPMPMVKKYGFVLRRAEVIKELSNG